MTPPFTNMPFGSSRPWLPRIQVHDGVPRALQHGPPGIQKPRPRTLRRIEGRRVRPIRAARIRTTKSPGSRSTADSSSGASQPPRNNSLLGPNLRNSRFLASRIGRRQWPSMAHAGVRRQQFRCDIHAHAPAKKSSTSLGLHSSVLQIVWHGHGCECHSSCGQSRPAGRGLRNLKQENGRSESSRRKHPRVENFEGLPLSGGMSPLGDESWLVSNPPNFQMLTT